MLVCLVFPLDFVLNFGEVIIGIAECIVDLRWGEVRIGLPDGLNCVSSMSTLINKADRNAGAHNDGIAPADRTILLDITVLGFDRVRHIRFLRLVNGPHSTSQPQNRQARRLFRVVLLIDGTPASTPGKSLPAIPIKVTVVAGQANALVYIPYLHFQKTTGLVDISNSGVERIVTDPELQAFQMRIPAGVPIIGWDGQPNTQISVRRVPMDRLPSPAPSGSCCRGRLYGLFRQSRRRHSV